MDDPHLRTEVSAADLTEACVNRANSDPFNAFIAITPDVATVDAARVDSARERGQRLPLDGIPFAVKDNIDVAGTTTSLACRAYAEQVALRDATVVRRMRDMGAIVIGKTNMHELAFGMTSQNPPPFGGVANPWDPARIPGGSSGGSAVAVIADACVAALGTDTGGSVRVPAALTGCSGLRPTLGGVSTDGVFPLSWSFDTVGPIARSAKEVARVYGALLGEDIAVDEPGFRERLDERGGTGGRLRVGVPSGFFIDGVAADVAAAVGGASSVFADLGAEVRPIDLRATVGLLDDIALVIRAEAFAIHRKRYEEAPDEFSESIRDRFDIGVAIPGWKVVAAQQRIRQWRSEVRVKLDDCDIIICPTTRTTAPPLGGDSIGVTWDMTWLTYPWTAAGGPSMSVPCGFGEDGLPIGLQVASGEGREWTILAAAHQFQELTDWHRRRPELHATESRRAGVS